MDKRHKLVYGLGGGLVYSCGSKGKWQQVLPKLLKSFENAVLISTVDMPKCAAKVIYDTVGTDRLYVDSGGFTLYKYQNKMGADSPEFHKECERMKNKYLNLLKVVKPCECFELDNEYFRQDEDLLSPKNYCREEIKAITGFYPTPVFKMHQGFEYWKRLCESDLYDKISIGGLAQTREWNLYRDEFRKMMNYARQCGKKVHLLGCQNVESFKTVKPDTIDYSIFQYAINLAHARKEHPELETYEELKIHAVLYAFARAKSRSFLYDNYIDGEDEEVDIV
jgi:hypothetical protein